MKIFYMLISVFLFLMTGCNKNSIKLEEKEDIHDNISTNEYDVDDDVPNPYKELILGKWVATEAITRGGEHIKLSSSSFNFFTQEYFSNGKCIITMPNRELSEEYIYKVDLTRIYYYYEVEDPNDIGFPYTLFDENKKLKNRNILVSYTWIYENPDAIIEFISEREK